MDPDGPSRMVKRPTGSGGEPSSPNCGASAGVKARQLTPSESFQIKDLDKFYRPRQAQCVTSCVTFPAQIMSQQTGLFQRNGTFYLRFIIPQRQRHLFDGRSRIVRSLNTTSKREANAHALALRAQLLNPVASTHLLIGPAKPTQDTQPSCTVRSLLAEWQAIKKLSQDIYRACEYLISIPRQEFLGINSRSSLAKFSRLLIQVSLP